MADSGMLSVSVTARQRLALGVGSEVSYFTATHSFVPGSVLRGALAAAWIAEHGPPTAGSGDQARFRDLFDGQIRYGPLHVPGATVIPVSVRMCKYPKDDDCKRQAVDEAFESAANSQCPACSGPLEQGKGDVVLPAEITLDRITRTSINPETGKAKDGELYAHGALPAGTQLTGTIYGRDSWLEQPRELRLGGRRTVGGMASYQAVPAVANGAGVSWKDEGLLVIRLTSPGVFVDAAGRPSLTPDPSLDLRGADVERPWARPQPWSGWHAASGLPKPEELCAVPGSTYRLTGTTELLRELAGWLPHEGIGLRRGEGFGCVEVVTTPWRPAPAAAPGRPTMREVTPAEELFTMVMDLRLSEEQHRWVVGALRDLQLDRERGGRGRPGDGLADGDLADDLLSRPAARDFSGRQRDRLRELFGGTDPRVLRDVLTLLLARSSSGGD